MSSGQGPGRFPLLRLLTGQTSELVEHAEAYAELAAEELAAAAAVTRRRLVAQAAGAFAALMALIFGGVALMLWGAVPADDSAPARWLLLLVPGIFAAASAGAVMYLRSHPKTPVFTELKSQWRQDMAMLREGLAR